MNEEYWRLRALNVALNILKGQESRTITRTEIDDMRRDIQITRLCYNDGLKDGRRSFLSKFENIKWFCDKLKLSYKDNIEIEAIYRHCNEIIKQLQKEIGGIK